MSLNVLVTNTVKIQSSVKKKKQDDAILLTKEIPLFLQENCIGIEKKIFN